MSIVEKMANDAAGPAWERFRNDPDVIRDWVTEEREHLARVLRATGLTEAQLEGLANGMMVCVPVEPTEVMCQNAALQVLFTDWCDLAEDDKVGLLHVYRAMLAAKEESE